MRAHIDISEVEAETKIRAKYLRALENEEWDLLPGPTYVKSFLRTYADALGLDGKLLIEEYKLRHERLSEVDLQPIAPRGVRDGRRPRRQQRGIAPGWIVGVVIAGLLVALYLLGKHSGGGPNTTPIRGATPVQPTGAKHPGKGAAPATPRPAAPPKARLTLVATAPVYVCLQAAGSRTLLPGVILQAGERRGPYRSRAFHVTLGNGNVRMVVNGRSLTVPAVSAGVGYVVSAKGRRTLPPGQRPTCGA